MNTEQLFSDTAVNSSTLNNSILLKQHVCVFKLLFPYKNFILLNQLCVQTLSFHYEQLNPVAAGDVCSNCHIYS